MAVRFWCLWLAAFLLLALSICAAAHPTTRQTRKPIVIVPGIMGSQLEARLHKTKSAHFYCRKSYDSWYRLWMNMDDIIPVTQNCFKENIQLHYNASSDQYSDTEGVDIRVVDFGNTTGIESLDPNLRSIAGYFDVFVEYFVQCGYTRGIDLRAAPFDWRLGPAQLLQRGYFDQLRQLIESTFSSLGNTKVTLLAHSMGALVSHYFLTRVVTETWKHTHLDQYITLGGAWAGSARSLRTLVSGNTEQIFKFSRRLNLRPLEREFPCDYWLLPVPSKTCWNDSVALVTTPTRNYTAKEIGSLLDDLKYPNGNLIYEGVANAMSDPLSPPNITTHCIYGNELDTEESYRFNEAFPDGDPTVSYGSGDGTVSLGSLQLCQEWAGQQAWPVKWYERKGAEHFGMLNDENILKIIEHLVITDNS